MDDLDFGATIKGFNPGQKVFKRYTLNKILGRGGMGVVWLAQDSELDREVALKFLPEIVALDPEALADLKRETRRNLALTHENIVRINDFVSDGRTAAISMEYVDGTTLSGLKLEKSARVFTTDELRPWLVQLCDALGYAHGRAKVVHRDLKPANLMLTKGGDLKITDFGIARGISDSVSRVSAQAGGSSGTPVYMSPQQMMGEKPAVTDDIYALGATLYELLTGKPPFYSGNVFMQVQNKMPPPIAERRQELEIAGEAVPAHWERTIAACLAKEAKDRPQSMAEFAQRLGLHGAPLMPVAPPPLLPPAPASAQPGARAAAQPAPVKDAAGEPAGVSGVRRWLLGPVLGALPTTLPACALIAGSAANDGSSWLGIAFGALLFSTLLGAFIFFLLLAIRRPWRVRHSWGITFLGCLCGGTWGVVSVTGGADAFYSVLGLVFGAFTGGLSGWVLYRVSVGETVDPAGKPPRMPPGRLYLGQGIVLLVAIFFFGVTLPAANKDLERQQQAAAEQRERERVQRESEQRTQAAAGLITEASRMVFDHAPTSGDLTDYTAKLVEHLDWDAARLRQEMRASDKGRKGGRLLVPEEFGTISAALQAANPGNAVHVAAGTYRESIHLNKAVELIGAGRDLVTVETESSRNVLQVDEVNGTTISGFTFRHTDTKDTERRATLVTISGSSVHFVRNAITAANGHGLSLQKGGNNTVSENNISGARWVGLAVYEKVGGEISRNEIHDNEQEGIAILEQPGRLEISRNTVHDNGDAGILIWKGDGVTLADNEAFLNGSKVADGGIGIFHEGGRPVLRGNVGRDNKGSGIWWIDDDKPPVIGSGNFSDGKELPLKK